MGEGGEQGRGFSEPPLDPTGDGGQGGVFSEPPLDPTLLNQTLQSKL